MEGRCSQRPAEPQAAPLQVWPPIQASSVESIGYLFFIADSIIPKTEG
jgi:hypothetical protein